MTEHYRQLVTGIEPEGLPRADRHWAQNQLESLENVPMAQPRKAASELIDLLKRMLESRTDGKLRMRVLDNVQACAQPLVDGLFKHIVAESHPLPPAKASLAASLLMLRRLQAENGCLAVWELTAPEGRVSLLGRKPVVLAVNQALDFLQDVLELSYQQYRSPPPGTWQRLHALYGFARDAGVAERRCTVPGGRGRRDAAHRYAQALLLALCNPWGMQRAELMQALDVSAVLADQVRFGTDAEGLVVQGGEPDSGPGFAAAEAEPAAAALSMDLDKVIEVIDQHLAWTPAEARVASLRDGDGGNIEVRRSMLEHMSRAWRGSVERHHERVAGEHVMTVLPGLSAIHQALAGGDDFETFRKRLMGDHIELGASSNAAAWLSGYSGSKAMHVEARVLDQSLGGYRLLWPSDNAHRVRIGELVALLPGLLDEDDEERSQVLMLGVLRWFREHEGNRLGVGVQLLSRVPRPALVRALDGQHQRSPMQRGLLLDAGDGAMELIVARVMDQRLEGVELSCAGDGQNLRPAMLRRRFAVDHVEELSPSYYRVSLSHSDATSQETGEAT